MTIVYILIAILIFGVLIIIHELGHFAAAKACGVRVEEFAVGMYRLSVKLLKHDADVVRVFHHLYGTLVVEFGTRQSQLAPKHIV